MPFPFNAVELYIVTINEKPWMRAREVCKALEYNKKTSDIVKAFCSKENYAQKYQMISVTAAGKPVDWLKDLQKCDIYTNEEGMYELAFGNQKPKVNNFRKHCCNVMFPQIRQQLPNKMKEDHQQAIEEIQGKHQQAIEKKDATIALLNDYLKIANTIT